MTDPLTMSVMAALMSPTAPLVCSMPQNPEQDVAQAVKAIRKIIIDYQDKALVFAKKVQAAESDEERQKIVEEGEPDISSHFLELKEIALAHPGTEAAVKAAFWVMSRQNQAKTPSEDGDWAFDILLNDFIDSEHIEDVPNFCSGMTTRYIETLERIRAESSNDRARALADYNRATQLIMMSKAAQELVEEGSSGVPMISYYMRQMDDELKTKLSTSGMADECQRAGEELLAHCQKAHTEIELYKDSGRMISALAERWLFEINNLQIGDVVPDIEGVDAEGIAFKLSDYKGQVVVIDFWGFW